jgi:hypothetical protein
MAQDLCIIASGLMQGAGQFGHPVEGSFVVNAVGQFDSAWRPPCRGKGHGQDGIAEDFSDQMGLSKKFVGLEAKLGSTGLGAPGSIAGGDGGIAGGGIPCGLASCSLASEPCGTHHLGIRYSISKLLRYIHGMTAKNINLIPHAPRTGHRKQAQFPFACPPGSLEEFKHGMRLSSILPF